MFVFKEDNRWLKGVVHKQIAGNRFKIECEVGDVKYFTKFQLENLMKEAAIPIGTLAIGLYVILMIFTTVHKSF